MDYHFKRCIEKKNLIKVDIDNDLIEKELEAADSDLKDSQDVLIELCICNKNGVGAGFFGNRGKNIPIGFAKLNNAGKIKCC